MLPEFDIEDTFRVFLEKARKHMLILYAFNIEDFIIEKYQAKGLSREKIFDLPLKDLWPLIENYKTRIKRSFWISKNRKIEKNKTSSCFYKLN
jgi:hypothetical protein